MNWENFKAPIMATIKVTGMMPGMPTYNTRFIFFIIVILPFIPIYKYSQKFKDESIIILLFFYFIFYLIFCITLTQLIKKIGKRWSESEYENLKPDQITFPFILVMIINSTFHFGIFYLLTKIFY
jgi:hypothetical protein